jgi:O-acetyl-ADP-ribose deacetylase (regulator of RNase III)
MTKIEILQGDITKLEVDAIVNAANESLLGGGGVDGAIHRAAGPKLLEECRKLNGCDTGDVKITKGFNLKAKFVIHTVGPVWRAGNFDEDSLLKSCYQKSLQIAEDNKLKSIAFPAISTGVYGFPFDRASKIALRTVYDFITQSNYLEKVIFVLFGESDFTIFHRIKKTMK